MKKLGEDIYILHTNLKEIKRKKNHHRSHEQFLIDREDEIKIWLEEFYEEISITLNDLHCSVSLLWKCSEYTNESKLQNKLFIKHLLYTFDLLSYIYKKSSRCCDFFNITNNMKDNKILISKIKKDLIFSLESIKLSIDRLNEDIVFISNIDSYSEEEISERTEKFKNLSINLKVYKDIEGYTKNEELIENQKEYLEKN